MRGSRGKGKPRLLLCTHKMQRVRRTKGKKRVGGVQGRQGTSTHARRHQRTAHPGTHSTTTNGHGHMGLHTPHHTHSCTGVGLPKHGRPRKKARSVLVGAPPRSATCARARSTAGPMLGPHGGTTQPRPIGSKPGLPARRTRKGARKSA